MKYAEAMFNCYVKYCMATLWARKGKYVVVLEGVASGTMHAALPLERGNTNLCECGDFFVDFETDDGSAYVVLYKGDDEVKRETIAIEMDCY